MKRFTPLALIGLATISLTNCGKSGNDFIEALAAPKVMLSVPAGEDFTLTINANYDDADEKDIYIDLNSNFQKDTGENLLKGTNTFQVSKKENLFIYGKLTKLAIEQQPEVTKIDVSNRHIQEMSFVNMDGLQTFLIANAQSLQKLNLSYNPRLTDVAKTIDKLPDNSKSKGELVLPANFAAAMTAEQEKLLTERGWQFTIPEPMDTNLASISESTVKSFESLLSDQPLPILRNNHSYFQKNGIVFFKTRNNHFGILKIEQTIHKDDGSTPFLRFDIKLFKKTGAPEERHYSVMYLYCIDLDDDNMKFSIETSDFEYKRVREDSNDLAIFPLNGAKFMYYK